MRTWQLIALWALAGVLWIALLPVAPVQRTQEARVLETAREMLGRPLNDWLIPRLNGQLRLKKPPLAYWLSAACFSVFGVTSMAGRLPAAVAGWLTLGVVYWVGARLFNPRTGLLASAMLLGSFMFFRFTRFAETDALAACFVTGAIGAICVLNWTNSGKLVWFHVFGVCTALAALAKGPPALFPVLFLIGISFLDRSLVWRFFKSGAVVTFTVIALPWFLYVYLSPASAQISEELQTVTLGGEHSHSFINYFPQLLLATAPWTGFVILALMAALVALQDVRNRILMIWLGCILVPLLVIQQRQFHYLLPAMPPLMMQAARFVDQAIAHRADRAVKVVIHGTCAAALCGAPVLLFIRAPLAPPQQVIDFAAAGVMVLGAVITVFVTLKRGSSSRIFALSVSSAIILAMLVGYWSPIHFERDPRVEAGQLRARFGNDARFYFINETMSLGLVFAMRQEIPLVSADEALMLATEPGTVLLSIAKEGRAPPPPPAPFVETFSIKADQRVLHAYQATAGTP